MKKNKMLSIREILVDLVPNSPNCEKNCKADCKDNCS